MRYLKTFEGNKYDFNIDEYLNKVDEYFNERELIYVKDIMKQLNFPMEFLDEFKILYYLYKDLDYDNIYGYYDDIQKTKNKYKKKKVKEYVLKLIYNKLEDDFDNYNKLSEWFEKRSKLTFFGEWNKTIHHQLYLNILFNFNTALRKSPLYKKIKDYNL